MKFEENNYELMLIKKLTKKENRIAVIKLFFAAIGSAIACYSLFVWFLNFVLWLGK